MRIREPYFRFRIKFLLLNLIGKTTDFQERIVSQIDSEESSQDEWIVPLAELVSRHNNEETVQNILSSILEVMMASNSEVKKQDIRSSCSEKKRMEISKRRSVILSKSKTKSEEREAEELQESLMEVKSVGLDL